MESIACALVLAFLAQCIRSAVFGDIFEAINSNFFTTSSDYYCSGAYSCYNAVALQRVTNDGNVGSIGCHGLFSCMNADLLYNNYGRVVCYEEKSCYNCNIYQMSGTTTYDLECGADRSCAESSIHSTTDVYFSGHLSGINSNIYSYNNLTNYYLQGFESGKGMTIFCGINTTCGIHCHGTACNNVTLICQDGTITSCAINATCISAEQSDVCPNGYNISDHDYNVSLRLPSIENISISTYDNSLIPCQNFSFNVNVNVNNSATNMSYVNKIIITIRKGYFLKG